MRRRLTRPIPAEARAIAKAIRVGVARPAKAAYRWWGSDLDGDIMCLDDTVGPYCPMGLHPESVAAEPTRVFLDFDEDAVAAFADWWDEQATEGVDPKIAMDAVWGRC